MARHPKYFADVPAMVRKMYNAQNGQCGYCGTPDMYIRTDVTQYYFETHKTKFATFEHIKPASEGGRYEISNGVCVCSECNGLRANMPVEEFFDRYEELLHRLRTKPARDLAKKQMNARKNGYIVAWFAKHTNQTVEDVFQSFTP
jgi:5-methylcytosine-specific restriction endonuclease McrA